MNQKKAEQWISQDLDGELSARGARRLEHWLERHPEAGGCRTIWRQMGETARTLPVAESVDAAQVWVAVRRRIRTEGRGAKTDEVKLVPPRLHPGWAPAGVMLLLGLGAWGWFHWAVGGGQVAQANRVERVETYLPGSSALVFEDEESGIAVVWMVSDEGGERDG